jgi:hypothetical protein
MQVPCYLPAMHAAAGVTSPDKPDRFHPGYTCMYASACQDKILELPFFDLCTGIGRKTEEISCVGVMLMDASVA